MTEEDLYIQILRFAESRDTFSLDDLCEAITLTKDQRKGLIRQIHGGKIFVHNVGSYDSCVDGNMEVSLYMSVEDKFRLIEYTALKEARTSSRNATYFASAAIFISCISTCISVFFSYTSQVNETNYHSDVENVYQEINGNITKMAETIRDEGSLNAEALKKIHSESHQQSISLSRIEKHHDEQREKSSMSSGASILNNGD